MGLIMVADDEEGLRRMYKDMLESLGHQVVVVADGVEMVEKAKDWRPQLIVSDLMMPGAYGSTANKSLLEDSVTSQIPVVFVTAVPLDRAEKVIPTGNPKVALLAKPVAIKDLAAAVARLLPANPTH